ncbi:DUF2889 domain-containing protein [Kiloniella sp. b19]|uniref:DUF2889 domain-containing protein n=1 Tax=Kiloniella sp. GXU_MW_B19 TaxID=3141326 RepID=UPI0031DBE341
MPLPPPDAERSPLHHRRYDFHGYERSDGLWDIEGRITDTKSYDFPNAWRGTIHVGEALHDMQVRLTINRDMEVINAEASIDDSPFAICPSITPNIKRVIGLKIGIGWRAGLRKVMGRTEGCTHLVEMLGAMGTVAFQTLSSERSKQREQQPQQEEKEKSPPPLLGSCHAFAPDSEVVRQLWPDFWTGADKSAPGEEKGKEQ